MLLTINLRYEIRQDLPVNLILSESTKKANAFDTNIFLMLYDFQMIYDTFMIFKYLYDDIFLLSDGNTKSQPPKRKRGNAMWTK